MKITENRIDDLNLELTIGLESADYAETLRKRLAERRRTADFKGFRKGNVPASLIKKVYGEQCLVEAVNVAVSQALDKHISDNSLHILGEPLSSEKQPEIEWVDGNEFTFVFDLALSPEVSFELSKDDSVPVYQVKIDKADKEKAIEQLKKYREQSAAKSEGEGAEGEKAEEPAPVSDEDLEKQAVESLERNYESHAEWRLTHDLREFLVGKAALTLPEAFLKRWLLEANKDKVSAEDVDKEFEGFLADFRWQLVRGYLMKKYDLKIEEADLREEAENYIKYQYMMYGIAELPADLIQQTVVNMLHDQNQVQRLAEQVENRKVFDRVKQEITVKPTKIGSKEFSELK